MSLEDYRRYPDDITDTQTLFKLIAQIRVGNRPARIEPRAIKQRPKPYPRLSKPRWEARKEIRKQGHEKKLRLI